MKLRLLLLSLLFFLSPFCLSAQEPGPGEIFREIILRVDTNQYLYSRDRISYNKEPHLPFRYTTEDEVAEFDLVPADTVIVEQISLIPSGDYELIDSLMDMNGDYYRFKVRFQNITETDFLKILLSVRTAGDEKPGKHEIRLLPYTPTRVQLADEVEELFIGEEKVIELISNNPQNIKEIAEWTRINGIDYRITRDFNQLRLHLLPNTLGRQEFRIELQTFKPFLTGRGQLDFSFPEIRKSLTVKQTRLQFLNIDKREVTLNEENRQTGIEVQMDNSRLLRMQKTYRVENREEPGGTLIAEIFTRNELTNNRVVCWLRVYNYHRKSDGYLYIKDGDQSLFITNIDITPQTSIEKVSILHEGNNWTENLSVNPGEVVDIKIEGQALHKASFFFEDLKNLEQDTTIRNENLVIYKVQIPLDINKKTVNLYNHGHPTGYQLKIREFRRPRPLDFVYVNFGNRNLEVDAVTGPVMYDQTITDVAIRFHENKIDEEEILYGNQYLKIDIKITNKEGQLLEMKSLDNILVSPGPKSKRFGYYETKNKITDQISLNNYIRKKTYDLEEWARIQLDISHQKDKYNGEGFSKTVEIILQKHYSFDIDVSFPAGLVFKKSTEEEFRNFGGISMAMIAQFSFYQKDKINRYRPYKIGAGFLALNAFNFGSDENVKRDMSIVILGSIYPTTKDAKLTFPLYIGGGYMLSGEWFMLLGPGIRVRL